MKYLIVALVLGLAFWIWRKNRSDRVQTKDESQVKSSKRSAGQPQLMITCAACGVHLPQSDAVIGQHGSYCSASHRREKEKA